MKARYPFAIFLLLGFSLVPAQEPAGQGPRPPMGGMQQYGPWNRDLEIFESADGRRFVKVGSAGERGGVPNLARAQDGTLYLIFQWFPLERPEAFDRIAVRRSVDDGASWTDPEPITIEGMPASLRRAFDPTLVALPEGGFRLYFASDRISPKRPRGNRAIFSGYSPDARHFTFEPGERFGFEEAETYDPGVAFFQGEWHLFCPISGEEGSAYHAVSRDGLHFERLENVSVPGPYTWIGNTLVTEGELWFYGSGRGGAWRARSGDGSHWELDRALELGGGDPAVALKRNKGWLAVTTGPLRPDARPGPPPVENR